MKTSRYMNRALKSRDSRFASVLTKLGYQPVTTRPATSEPPKPKQAPQIVAPVVRERAVPPPRPDDAGTEIAKLRQTYEEKFGKRPYMGWDTAALRAKLAEAPETGRYARRDLRAED